MIPFRFNENQFSFLAADHLLVGQLCTNPKSDRSLLSCPKVTQCSTSEICTTHALYRSKLWQQDHCQHLQNANPGGSTCPGWWKQSFRLWLWSLVWFQVRATSCHLTSSKSAWKSKTKCTWMWWRVWWSPGAIRWPVADAGCGGRSRSRPKRPRLGFCRSATILYPSLTGLPPPPTWTRWTTSFGHTSRTSPTEPPTTPKKPDRHHPPSIRRAPTGACGKGMLSVPDPYRGGDWSWRRLHWIYVNSTT